MEVFLFSTKKVYLKAEKVIFKETADPKYNFYFYI
jgi:hypothetical protein